MTTEMEDLAGIEEGDSNELCLAKTMITIDSYLSFGPDPEIFLALIQEGVTYANEVINARGE